MLYQNYPRNKKTVSSRNLSLTADRLRNLCTAWIYSSLHHDVTNYRAESITNSCAAGNARVHRGTPSVPPVGLDLRNLLNSIPWMAVLDAERSIPGVKMGPGTLYRASIIHYSCTFKASGGYDPDPTSQFTRQCVVWIACGGLPLSENASACGLKEA